MAHVDFSFDHFPEFELERFRLRPLRTDDAEAVFAYLSDEEVMRYRSVPPLTELEQAEDWMQDRETEFQAKRVIRWAIARKEDDRLVGTVLLFHFDRQNFRAEIGYDLAREYWGQGVVTEILKTIIAFGYERLGLNRIEAILFPENIGSRRVLEKNGFTVDGTLKEYWYIKEQFCNALMMSLRRKDYASIK